jgi:outer membrane protein OmpA-like peptidoglycan-associated protein
MERAAAVVVGGIGLVLLALAAMTVVGNDPEPSGGGVDLAVFATTAPVTGATVLGTTASVPPAPSSASPSSPAPGAPAAGSPATPTSTTVVPPPSTAAVPPPAPAVPPELVEAIRLVSDGGVRFDVGRAKLNPTAVARLTGLAAQLRARPDVVVVVVGHTDSTGTDEVNRPLSQRRALAVVDFLVQQGVQPSQLRADGLGPDRPVADNDSPDGRQANRRSEVSVETRS